MKQIEITVRVNNSLKEVDNILIKQGFNIIRKSRIEDKYLTNSNMILTERNILKILSKSVLIRYVKTNDKEYKNITYKKKEYNKKQVLSEIKYSVNIDDINKAYDLFIELGYKKIVEVKYDAIVYSNGETELAFQNVENLGLLLEVENEKDFQNTSDKDIIKEKKKMVKELSKYKLNISKDYDIKKAYELIKGEIL